MHSIQSSILTLDLMYLFLYYTGQNCFKISDYITRQKTISQFSSWVANATELLYSHGEMWVGSCTDGAEKRRLTSQNGALQVVGGNNVLRVEFPESIPRIFFVHLTITVSKHVCSLQYLFINSKREEQQFFDEWHKRLNRKKTYSICRCS